MVHHYLQSFGGSGEQRSIIIRRNEILKKKLPSNPLTYRQLIMDSSKSSKKRTNQFKTNTEIMIKDRARIAQETASLLATEHHKVLKVLKKPQLIKLTADQILEIHGNRRRFGGHAQFIHATTE